MPAAFGFVAALLSRIRPGAPLLLVTSPCGLATFGRPHGHGLNSLGLDPARLILVETPNDTQALWAMEEALRSAVPAAVAGAIGQARSQSQPAAASRGRRTGRLLLLLRPPRHRSERRGDALAHRRGRGRARPLRPHRALALAAQARALPQRTTGRMVSGVRSCRASFQSGCRAGRSCAFSQPRRAIHAHALTRTPVDPERPFVLTVEASGGPRIAALNEAAESGRARGRRSARRCARESRRRCRCAPPIRPPTMPRCAAWRCGRRAIRPRSRPGASENGADGFFLDVTGAAHLFGGEETLLADLVAAARSFRPAGAARHRRYRRRGLGAVALSSRASRSCRPDRKPKRLRPCRSKRCGCRPIRARRCGGSASSASASLIDKPRAPFAARFESRTADSASTRRSAARPSRFALIAPPPVYHSLRYLHGADRHARRPSSRSRPA